MTPFPLLRPPGRGNERLLLAAAVNETASIPRGYLAVPWKKRYAICARARNFLCLQTRLKQGAPLIENGPAGQSCSTCCAPLLKTRYSTRALAARATFVHGEMMDCFCFPACRSHSDTTPSLSGRSQTWTLCARLRLRIISLLGSLFGVRSSRKQHHNYLQSSY